MNIQRFQFELNNIYLRLFFFFKYRIVKTIQQIFFLRKKYQDTKILHEIVLSCN